MQQEFMKLAYFTLCACLGAEAASGPLLTAPPPTPLPPLTHAPAVVPAQTTRGSCWRARSMRSTTTTPAASALRSCTGALLQREPEHGCCSVSSACIGALPGRILLNTSGLPAPTVPPPCSNAYNMVVNKHGERLYRGLVETETSHLQKVGTAGLPCGWQGRRDGAHHARERCGCAAALCCRSARGRQHIAGGNATIPALQCSVLLQTLRPPHRHALPAGSGPDRGGAGRGLPASHQVGVGQPQQERARGCWARGVARVLDWLAGLLAGALLCTGISQMLLELSTQPR